MKKLDNFSNCLSVLKNADFKLAENNEIYRTGVIGQFTDRILANDLKEAKLFLFQLLIAFVISVVVMPLLDLTANIFAFRKGLIH